MEQHKHNIVALGGVLLSAAAFFLSTPAIATATGLAVSSGALLNLANTFAGGLLGTNFSKLGLHDKLLSKLRSKDPNKINHDLERLIKQSTIIAFAYMRELYLSDLQDDQLLWNRYNEREKKTYISAIKSFFNDAEEDLKDGITVADIDKIIINSPDEYLEKIINYIITISDIRFDEDGRKRFIDFYKNKMTSCFQLAFKETLKRDELGFKSFQIWVLQDLQAQTTKIATDQRTILDAIARVESGQNLLSKNELEQLLNREINQIVHLLAESFQDVEYNFTRLTEKIDRNFEKQFRISEEMLIALRDLRGDLGTATETIINAIKEQNKSSRKKVLRYIGSPFRTDVFLGREEQMKDVKEQLKLHKKIFLISGEAGMGKTTLASQYWLANANAYKHLIWLTIETDIVRSLISLGPNLDINFPSQSLDNERLNKTIDTLVSLPGPCLLIIDNANDRKDLVANIQQLKKLVNFDILLTTWCNDLPGTKQIKLPPLRIEVAIKLFGYHYCEDEANLEEKDLPVVRSILNAIGSNTLIIEVLAKNLRELNNSLGSSISIDQYLIDLKKGILKFKNQKKVVVDYHNDALEEATPLEIIEAMYNLALLTSDEIKLLNNLAVLPAESIRYDLLKLLLKPDDEDVLQGQLQSLYRKGWLDLNTQESNLKLSPVIQQVILEKNRESLLDDNTRLIENIKFLLFNYNTNFVAKVVSPLALSVVNILNLEDRRVSFLAHALAKHYHEAGNLTSAEAMLKNIIDTPHFQQENNELLRFYVFTDYADVLDSLDRLVEADAYYTRLLTLVADSKNPELDEKFNKETYAMFLGRFGKYAEAEPTIFGSFKSKWRELREDDHITVNEYAIAAHNMAKLLRRQGRYDEALTYHSIAKSRYEKIIDHKNYTVSSYGIILLNFADTLLQVGDIDIAENFATGAYDYMKTDFAEDHHYIGYACMTLSDIYRVKKDIQNMQKFSKMGVSILEEKVGPTCRDICDALILDAEFAYDLYCEDKISPEQLLNISASLIELTTEKLMLLLNRYGPYNDILHKGLEIAEKILRLDSKEEAEQKLYNIRQELIRLTIVRGNIRTIDFAFETLSDDERITQLQNCRSLMSLPVNLDNVRIEKFNLPFYKSFRLFKITYKNTVQPVFRYVLSNEEELGLINYKNGVIYHVGKSDGSFDMNNIASYMRFFFDSVCGRHGFFHLMHENDEMPWIYDEEISDEFKKNVLNKLPKEREYQFVNDIYSSNVLILFRKALFKATFNVALNGECELVNQTLGGSADDKPLVFGLDDEEDNDSNLKEFSSFEGEIIKGYVKDFKDDFLPARIDFEFSEDDLELLNEINQKEPRLTFHDFSELA